VLSVKSIQQTVVSRVQTTGGRQEGTDSRVQTAVCRHQTGGYRHQTSCNIQHPAASSHQGADIIHQATSSSQQPAAKGKEETLRSIQKINVIYAHFGSAIYEVA
jgi:hypothetical protein